MTIQVLLLKSKVLRWCEIDSYACHFNDIFNV